MQLGPKTRLMLISSFVLAGWTFLQIGQLYSIEQWYCNRYYAEHPNERRQEASANVAEERCKLSAIQAPTASFNGLLQFVCLVPGLLVGDAFTKLSEKWGRKTMFAFNALGISLQTIFRIIIFHNPQLFSVHWVLAASPFGLIGGGDTVQWGLLYAYIFESASQGNPMDFMCYSSAYLAASRALGAALGGELLSVSVWILWGGAVLVNICTMLLAKFLPNQALSSTAYAAVGNEEELDDWAEHDSHELPNGNGNGHADGHANGNTHKYTSSTSRKASTTTISLTWRTVIRDVVDSAMFAVKIVRNKPKQRLIATIFFFTTVGGGVEFILQQYISQAYNIPLSEAASVASGQFVGATFILLSLPTISRLVAKQFGISRARSILVILYASLILAAVGSILMGLDLPWGLFLMSLAFTTVGYGAFDAVRAFSVTYITGERETVELTLMLTMTEQVCMLVNGPAANLLFSLLLSVAVLPNGMLFWALSGFSIVACVMSRRLWNQAAP